MRLKSVFSIVFVATLIGLEGGEALAWDAGPVACKHTDESSCADNRGNTHLWIVNNAVKLLSTSTASVDKAIVKALNDPMCKSAWEDGLWETDCSSAVDGCSSDPSLGDPPRLGSHFYNDNGKDYFGSSSSCETYLILTECQTADGTARKNAAEFVEKVTDLGSTSSCHYLGNALHYFTDTTMPFHASGLSAASLFLPPDLHGKWENWVGTQHGAFPAVGNWSKTGVNGSADALVDATSTQSFGHMKPFFEAMDLSPGSVSWSTNQFGSTLDALDAMLQDAFQETASYLHLILENKVND